MSRITITVGEPDRAAIETIQAATGAKTASDAIGRALQDYAGRLERRLHRVVLRTTSSLQPGGGTHWEREILYCGYDRAEARRVAAEAEPREVHRGYGNRCVDVVLDELRDE